MKRFLDEVDPDRVLPEPDRLRRAASARKAYFTRLAFLASRRRRQRKSRGRGGNPMETWWSYQLHNAQAALEAVLEIDRVYTPDEVTGLGVCSRQGPDERDHLYIAVCSKNPPQGRIQGVDETLSRYGEPSVLTNDDLDEPRGRQWVASGPIDIIIAMLLAQHPGEIELDGPEGSPRIYWAGQ